MIKEPGNLPNLQEGQMDHERERARIMWHCHVQEYQNIHTMNELLADLLLEALPDCFVEDLQ